MAIQNSLTHNSAAGGALVRNTVSGAASATLGSAARRAPLPMPWNTRSKGAAPAAPAVLDNCNAILSALPADVLQRFAPHLRRVLLHQDDTLHERGHEVRHVYFVEKGMISLVADARCGAQFEVAVIGSEGMTGALSVLGNHPGVHFAMVQVAGKAYRLPMEILREEWKQNPALQSWLLSHANLLMAQASQNALCSRIHPLEERLSRWLLTVRDRIQSDELDLTHDSIARMLGTRRPGVTVALGSLQQAKLIECGRGRVLIKDQRKLERCACECYGTLRRQFQSFENQLGSDF